MIVADIRAKKAGLPSNRELDGQEKATAALEQAKALDEIRSGINLKKCQQCGCMQETLDQISQALPKLPEENVADFKAGLPGWRDKMKSVGYSCLGCDHCFAGTGQNAFASAFPQVADSFSLSCEIQVNENAWPPVVGDFIVVDPDAPVAVVTLASSDLSKHISERGSEGLAIVGKLETENIGVDKLIKNMIANPKLRFLVVAGVESVGHLSGQTLLALVENGTDANDRVIGSKGKRPVLRNVSREEMETFRRQVQVVDLIGCEDVERIAGLVRKLAQQEIEKLVDVAPYGCSGST